MATASDEGEPTRVVTVGIGGTKEVALRNTRASRWNKQPEFSSTQTSSSTRRISGDTIANLFDKRNDNLVDIPLGLRLNTVFRRDQFTFVAPELRATWIYSASERNPSATGGFVGTGSSMKIAGVAPGDTCWQLGAGFKAQFSERLSARVDYNYEFRDKFNEHNLTAEVGLSF